MRIQADRVSALTSLVLMLCLSLPLPGFAQATTGTIEGTVKDQSGAAISKAKITIKNVETNVSREATTDDGGRYLVPALPLGFYEVKAEHQGFSSQLRGGIELTVGRVAVVDFELPVGRVEDTMTINAEAPLVETTSPVLAGLVAERDIKELPLNGRDVFQLTTLQVGVINTAGITSTFGAGAIDVGPGTTKISVNGARITTNSFTLDGTRVNDALNNTPGSVSGGFTGVDMLQEFQILTNNYSAEHGTAGGAIINAVTKSGSNEVHGTAFEFHRNDNFDARNFFDPGDVPEFKRNQFGGSIGGPIFQNRTFFFGGYEGLRQDLGVSRRFSVPTPAARARAVPSVQPYVNLYPLPNGEALDADTAFYLRPSSDQTRGDSFMVRIDHMISRRDSLFGRYSFDDSETALEDLLIQNSVTSGRNQYFTLNETHIFSQRVVNSFRFGFNRSAIATNRPFIIDVPESLSFVPGRPLGTFFGFTEVASLADSIFTPRFFAFNQFEFTDDLSVVRGAHSLKMGFTARRIQLNADSVQALDGIYVYFGLPGLSTLDTFLLGLPGAFVAPRPGSDFYRGIRESIFGSFIQDDWKVTPRLTLNLGLRYEFITSPTEVNDKISNLRNLKDPAPTVGFPFFENPSKKNFAPRIGFAYDLTGDGKTSLRGGYGIFDILIQPFDFRVEISNQEPFAGLAFVLGPPPNFFPAPFPNGFQSIQNAVPLPSSVNTFDFNPDRSYMQHFNLSIQREIVPTFVLTVAYAGSRGVHLARKNSVNQRTDFIFVNGRKVFPELPEGESPESRRLNPNLAAIRHIGWDGNSNYHSLQVRTEKRFSHGLNFQTSYTWSRAIDDASTTESAFSSTAPGSRVQDAFDSRAERGRASFDATHNFVAAATYEFPINAGFTGVTDKLLNGWEVTGLLTTRSGFPFGLFIGFDRANDASADDVAQRPDVVPGRSYESAVTGRIEQYVDPTAFRLAPPGAYGNSGRNVLEGPGFVTFDLGLFKNTPVSERVRIQFRAEAFNLFNRANFAIPDNLTLFVDEQETVPGNFARITRTTSTSRQLQFGLKLIF
ncbi:MAG TPA: TonB-dependent receptor [Blastocatellia bacterium]|nr:TonB-dependent receptor [Blastocatellia bacterium]